MTVRMTHPDLDGEIEATPGQVPHLERSGWQQVEGQEEAGETWPEGLQLFGGQQPVRMYHPDLEGDPITVAESAAPFHRERGWQVIEPAEEAMTGAFIEEASLADLTVPELRDLAKERGISPVPATKPELLAALSSEQATEDQAGVEPAQPQDKEA